MTQALEPISSEALAQSLDTLRTLPTLVASHEQANAFDSANFYPALHVVQMALHRLERQSTLLYLERTLDKLGLESLAFSDGGQESLLVSVSGRDAEGNDADEEDMEEVAEFINDRMDGLFEGFVRDFLMPSEEAPITRQTLKDAGAKGVGPDFEAAREALELQKALPGVARASKKRTKSRM